MRTVNATGLPDFVRKAVEFVSDFATVVGNLIKDIRDSYRPELHYMRGPGPKWCAKYQPQKRSDYDSARSSSGSELSPVYVVARSRSHAGFPNS